EFQIDGTHGSAVAGLFGCVCQPRGVGGAGPPPPPPARPARGRAPGGGGATPRRALGRKNPSGTIDGQ
ncbi:hypothetical protein U6X02_12365, partial [Cutibacterium acnes]